MIQFNSVVKLCSTNVLLEGGLSISAHSTLLYMVIKFLLNFTHCYLTLLNRDVKASMLVWP